MFKPTDIVMEISGVCNAKCPYCVKGSGAQRQGSFISLYTLDKILHHLKKYQLISKSGCITLSNWGEPMLHPEINEILNRIRKYGLRAFISTNLIYLPKLTKESLFVIKELKVSLSGFTQESYGYIHGKRLTSVLQNIDQLQHMIDRSGSKLKLHVHWHRYRFNENELNEAKAYFKQRGINFYASAAYLNDLKRTQDYFFNHTLPESERKTIEKDLFTEFLRKSYLDSRDIHYHCPEWKWLTLDENANLLLCCGWSNEVDGSVLGSLFDYDSENIELVKRSSPLCHKCLEQGIAKWVHNQGNFSLSIHVLISFKKILDRLGLTYILPEKSGKKIYSLVAEFMEKKQGDLFGRS